MPHERATDLVARMSGPGYVCRTGIGLLSERDFGREREIAARLNIDARDYADILLQSARPESGFIGIRAEAEEKRLDGLANATGGSICLLIFNFDVALSRLRVDERESLWANLYSRFPHRTHALLIAIPEAAIDLRPAATSWEKWLETERVAQLGDR